ncbi:dynamin-1 [Plenodomus tracheiphilus IPT5]|uniref:Dynamin-1 n=1 Tax=Plenodomus tracheiphilus IPT5 TaxID=1408161 RepID=A0A6A7AUL6_9PLEO|nr:dynamin-1 [Plenodomus tracheiphilus IPT5]
MAQDGSNVNTLDQLQTPQQVELLDKIDELRSQGLGQYGISLPQLIVCGDQSSGKSSLLEGLTRLRFPAKETKCTAFATEVVLRRSSEVMITCSIIPGKLRSQTERLQLEKFRRTFTSRDDFVFPSVLNDARDSMAPNGSRTNGDFFQDVLRVQYTGPELPSLTIVDLPGIIKNQLEGGNGPEKVLELVTGYMRDDKSIILAVVPGSYDPENQEIFTYLKQYDPDRVRTLGIITKPDMVERGGENEKEMMKLARNEKWPLKHRWHAIKNRSFTTRNQTDAERDNAEETFFSTGIWSSLAREDTGIAALRIKLSRVLLQHISKELPSLITEVESAAQTTRKQLKALGDARDTISKQRSYLTAHAEAFQTLTRDALRGVYRGRFFALGTSEEQAPTRLRTEVQNLNLAYVHVMYSKGHTWNISTEHTTNSTRALTEATISSAAQEYEAKFPPPSTIDRSEFLEQHIGDYVRRSRPAGLPSIVNPWVIGEVFRQQAQSWNEITQYHLRQIFQAMKDYIWEALGSLLDPRTCKLLMLKQILPELDQRWRNVEVKLEELLVPYAEQDPVTYDPSFIAELEEVRNARYNARSHVSDSHGGTRGFGHATDTAYMRSASRSLLTESLDDFTNSEILDLMQTYYKRAIAVFTNNIAILAIENCLMKDLSSIFSPSLIIGLDDDKIQAIAAESKDIREDRVKRTQKLAAFEIGRNILYEHMAMTPQIRGKKPVASPSKPIVDIARTQTPSPRMVSEIVRPQKHVDDLSSEFNQLMVTPPSSRSNSATRSHHRVDSAMGTPSANPKERKRVTRNMFDVPRSPVAVEMTDDEL